MNNSTKKKGRLSAGIIPIVIVVLLLSSVIATTMNTSLPHVETADARSYERDNAAQEEINVMLETPSESHSDIISTTEKPIANTKEKLTGSPAAVSTTLKSGTIQNKDGPTTSTPATVTQLKKNDETALTPNNISPSTIGQDSGNFEAQAALASPITAPSTNIVNVKATYDIAFRTATAGAIKRVEMQFPAGTNLGVLSKVEVSGLGAGVFSITGTTLTYIVTSAVNVPANTQINFVIGNLVNPASPVNTPLTVSITTKDSGGTIIDGPTPTNTYNLRNINTAELADDAVTLSKIAPGSVFSSASAQQIATLQENVAPGATHSVIAECPSGFFPTGGGFGSTNNGNLFILAMGVSFSPLGWEVTAHNFGATTLTVQANAACLRLSLNP